MITKNQDGNQFLPYESTSLKLSYFTESIRNVIAYSAPTENYPGKTIETVTNILNGNVFYIVYLSNRTKQESFYSIEKAIKYYNYL